MIYFSSLFTEANSSKIKYKNKDIYQDDTYDLLGIHKIKLRFISCNSKYIQAIVLDLYNFKGQIYLEGQEIKNPKRAFPSINFWQDTAPSEIELTINLESGNLGICNGSDPIGDKKICHRMSFGCAMMIEELSPTKKRYYCNDHENDDDFDDLVFEIEILD